MKKLVIILLCMFFVSMAYSEGTQQSTPERIKELIKQLGDDNWEMRKNAQKALEAIGEPAETALMETLQSTDLEVKNRVTFILKFITVKKRIKLSDMLLKEFPDIYKNLAIQNAGGNFTILQQITVRDKEGAFKYNGKVTNQDIAGLIGEILLENGQGLDSDQKQVILSVAIGTMYDGKSADGGWCCPIPESAHHLIKLLKDEDAFIRTATVSALGELGAKEAIPEILKLLRDDDNWMFRSRAASTLGKLGAKEAIPELIKLLHDEDSIVRRTAAFALGELGANEAIPEIMKLLEDEDDSARIKAASALGELGAKEAIPQLIKLLDYRASDVRSAAGLAIGTLGAKEAIPKLIKLLKDNPNKLHSWAGIVLVELGAKDKVPKETIADIKDMLKGRGCEEKYIKRVQTALKELGVIEEM